MSHFLRWFRGSSAALPARSVRPELEQLEGRQLPAPLHLSAPAQAVAETPGHVLPVRAEKLVPDNSGQFLHGLWDAARRGGRYEQPTAAELRLAEQLFRRTLLGQGSLAGLRRAWQRLHFDLSAVNSGRETFLVLREEAGHKTGRGFYVFRLPGAAGIALQAPHGTDDAFTGTIALNLFQEGPILAGAWNTVKRSSGGGKNSTDMAHLKSSYFQAFTRAFALAHPQGVVLQLHGFEGDNQQETPRNADMIVSNGTFTPAPWVVRVARLMKRDLSAGVKLFPIEVGELGGTTNAQSRLLQGLGHDGFLHLEVRFEFRVILRDQPAVRAALLNDLLTAYQERLR